MKAPVPIAGWLRRGLLSAGLLALLSLPLPLSCAATDGGDMASTDTPADGGVMPPDLVFAGCFMGTPQREIELLNACTGADRLDRDGRIPAGVWDGRGPLPQVPP